MAPTNTVTVLERCLAAPPPGTVSEMSLPLTFCDMMWIGFFPVQRLVFYECPVSTSHFIDSIIPMLKNSLSLSLEHFWALAGNLKLPSDSGKPEICYVDGDSVSLVFAESSFRDFDYLIGNQARNCCEFYSLVPQLPQSSELSGTRIVPLIALQVTLFPEIGICIGITNQHLAGDGSTMYAFMKAWAVLSKLGHDAASLASEYLPFYDRNVMGDTKEIGDRVWKYMQNNVTDDRHDQNLPIDTDKVRATFVISLEDVRRLKNYVLYQQPSLEHLSTFTVACGYVWTCMVKSGNATMAEVVEDEVENFIFMADCRGRSDPPISANYFGNCILPCLVSAKNRQLSEEGGFPIAAELIGKTIYERLQKKEGVFKGIETSFSSFSKVNPERSLGVAGSPRHNYYNIDFGWGKPKKFEFVSIDKTGAISLCGCRDSGGLEIGLALPGKRMDAFTVFFKEGLKAM